jgi:hypothetical protein
MSRTATIDMDVAQDPPPTWTADWVRVRLVEAYRIEQRLPGHVRRKIVAPWPAHAYEFSDIVGWSDDASERVLDKWAHTRGGVYASEMSRLEAAHEWLRVQLASYAAERMCLSGWAACIAYGHSVRALVVRKRWSRASFYRRVDTGSIIIARALQREGVKVE